MKKRKVLRYLTKVGMTIVSFSLITSPVSAVDATLISSEGGQKVTKEAFEAALKVARGKPAMTSATTIVCLACVPLAGAAASPGLCIACGILIAKTFG